MLINTLAPKQTKLLFLLSAGLTLLFSAMLFTFQAPKAHAINENTANVPQFIQDDFYSNPDCLNDEPPFDPPKFNQAQFSWMSIAGNNGVDELNVPYGTDRVDLWLNSLDAICNGAVDGNGNIVDQNLKKTRYNVVSTTSTAGTVHDLGGNYTEVDLNPAYYFNSRWTKELNLPAGIDRPWIMPFHITGLANLPPGDHDIIITATARVVNEFGGPVYQCVASPRQFTNNLTGLGDPNNPFDDCNTFPQGFKIKIRVGQPRINGYFDAADCHIFRGWAVDQDAPNSAVNVQFFADAPAGQPGSRYVGQTSANQPAYPGEPGWLNGHRFSFSPPTWLYDSSAHRIYAYALSVNDPSKSLQLPTSAAGSQGYYDMGPCAGTVYISKYEPPSRPNIGLPSFLAQNNIINDATAEVCIENQGGFEFSCNTQSPAGNGTVPSGTGNLYSYNGWRKDGIWSFGPPNNPYKVNIYLPSGWRIGRITNNQAGVISTIGFTCLGPNSGRGGTEKCVSNGIQVPGGSWSWFDIWYTQSAPPACSLIRSLDPLNANNPFSSSKEVGQPMSIAFSAPTNLPAGATQFSVSNLSSSPAGLTGFTGSHGPAAPGSEIIVSGINSTAAYRYSVSYTVNWNGPAAGSMNCPGEITVTTKPYMKVYGNDIKAGSSVKVNSVCAVPTNPKATILTFARGTPTGGGGNAEDWKGSSTQFAAFALGEIAEFYSAGQNGPRTNTPPGSMQAHPVLDLTFGNYDPDNEIQDHPVNQNPNLLDVRKVEGYGGDGGMAGCFDDYYQAISTGGGTAVGPTVGPKTITGAEAEYRNGDVMINGNIDLAGSWAEGNAPSYYLAVKGNIYIQPGVERISGVFIALDDGSGTKGRIYTCANGTGLYSSAELLEACNDRRLTINGAFVAKQVKFLRTINTLRDGAPNEAVGASRAAEVFNFGPETYMANPHSSLNKGSQKVQYDFITSLPPIL